MVVYNRSMQNRSPGGQFINAQSQRITQDVVPQSPLQIYRPVGMRIIPTVWTELFPETEGDILITSLQVFKLGAAATTIEVAETDGAIPTRANVVWNVNGNARTDIFRDANAHIVPAGRSFWWREGPPTTGFLSSWGVAQEIRGRIGSVNYA